MSADVVAFSGGMSGGKSSVSREVASRLDWPRVSFGDQVRSVVRSRSLDSTDRDTLQTVGQELVDADPFSFCRAVLSQAGSMWVPGKSLVIDGLRHVEVGTALRELVRPSTLRIVLIDADLALRTTRAHGQVEAADFARWDQHPTEVQITSKIRKIADLVVDGAQSIEAIASMVTEWIENREGLRKA